MVSVTITSGGRGVLALVGRAVAMDSMATARLRAFDDSSADVFVTTPMGSIASRRVKVATPCEDVVVTASALQEALERSSENVDVSPGGLWPGMLPPRDGYDVIDVLPATVVRHVADQGVALAKQFSGPLGPPASLLDQEVITVTSEAGTSAMIPMRMVFACTSLGLIPGPGAPLDIPRQLRVSTAGSWVRIDAPYGSVYRSRSILSL